MRLAAFATAAVSFAAAFLSKSWQVAAALGPVCCFLCFLYGYVKGLEDKRIQFLKLMEAKSVAPGRCTIPPSGWWCSRKPGHEGPCAAREFEQSNFRPGK